MIKLKYLSISFLAFTLFSFNSLSFVSAASIINVDQSREKSQIEKESLTSPYTGAAVHSYSFFTSPGTNSLNPTISLVYGSHGVNSLENAYGSGWSLNASYIERDSNYTPSNTTDDTFYLNLQGSRQKLIYDSTAGFYKTQTDSYTRVQQLSGSGNNSQSNYWLVTTPDGTQLRFGYEATSEEVCSDRSYVRRWYLDLVTDTSNNKVYYTYEETDNYSYLDKIEYNNDKTRLIDFNYEATTSGRIGTLAGCRVEQTQRLESLDIKANSQLFKTYEVSYEEKDTTQNLITSIVEKDDSGNPLPSTTFTYHDEVREWSTTPSTWYDDDGNPDIGLDYKQTRLIDVNRDTLPDILWSQLDSSDRKLKVYLNTGSSWMTTSETWYDQTTYPEVDLTRDDVTLADVNGDSLPDFVWSKDMGSNEMEWYVLTNEGDSWDTTADKWYDSTVDGLLNLEETTVGLYDVNGDGKPEIVRSEEFEDSGTYYRLIIYLNTGSGWSDTPQTWLTTDLAVSLEKDPTTYVDTDDDEIPDQVEYFNSSTRIIDVTNDGLPDVVYSEPYNSGDNRRWNVFINKGDSFDSSAENWFEDSSDFDLSNRKFTMFDANGDGYVDIVKGQKTSGDNVKWDVWLNNGNGWNKPAIEFLHDDSHPELGLDTNNVAAADVNGDGYVDLVSSIKEENNSRIWKVTLNSAYAANRLSQAKNMAGGTTSLSYTPSTAYDNTNSDDINDLPFPLWLISQSTQNNGMTGTHQRIATVNYSYEGGLYDLDEREVRGFNKVTSTDSLSKSIHLFHQDTGRQGREYQTSYKALNDTLYREVENTWSNSETGGIYTVALSSTLDSKYDGQGTPFETQTDYTYDSYGNPTEIESLGDTSDSDDDRVTNLEYTYNTTDWLVSYPKHRWLEDADDTKISESSIYYDGNTSIDTAPSDGLVTKEVHWHDRGQDPTILYTYDSYGNQITMTDPNGYVTETEYGTNDTTYTYPDSQTNELDQETSFTYDFVTGNLLSVTDSNSYVTSYTYDDFGRVVKEISPYDSSSYPTITYSYDLDGTAPEVITTEQMLEASTSATLIKREITDGQGQVIQTKQSAENPANNIIVNNYYDFRGNNTGLSNPYEATASATYTTPDITKPRTTVTYDLLNRPTEFENPDATSKTITYDREHVTYVDENTNEIDHYLDGFGQIKSIEEHNDSNTYETEYVYDALGNLRQITDDQNNTTLFTYDSLGRQIGITDPDMGTWLYYYDKNGNVGTTIDNRGVIVYNQYDELNRISLRDFPTDPDISYTYDSAVDGTLAQVSTSDYTMSYSYDQRLRQTSETMAMDSQSWTTSTFYNSADQVRGITYPDEQFVEYAINNQGLVESVGSIITDIDYTPAGKIVSQTYANSLTSSYTYDADTTRLTRLQTGSYQDLTYVYDDVGNITDWEDAVTGTDKTFTYDELNRITSASDPMGDSYSYDYDSISNLISLGYNGDYYQFEYGYTAGPHALSSANFTSPLGNPLPAYTQPLTNHTYGYYVAFAADDTVGGITVTTNDIGHYNDLTDTWELYFDGSDVGVDEDIDAINLMQDGSILMSFADTIDLGWGNVDHRDIVRFIPTSIGDTTAGAFELYFDGSDVGLSLSSHKIAAITSTANGDLLLRTGYPSNSKLRRFTPTALKHFTEGDFYDYSFVEPNNYTITASWYEPETNTMYYADSHDTDIHTCVSVEIDGDSECTSTSTIDTSSWDIDETISGLHYYTGSQVLTAPKDPELVTGVYFSGSSYVDIGATTYNDEDVIYWDLETNTWSLFIDGSDLSLSEIAAIHVMDDGNILMAFGGSQSLSFGTASSNDVVKFTPTSTGSTTSGTFEMYFDGSDIGISSFDDITSISQDPSGNLLIALDRTQDGSPVWGDVNDIYVFNATSLGSTTAGTLERYFEGTDELLINSYPRKYTDIYSSPAGNLYLGFDYTTSNDNVTAQYQEDIMRCQITGTGTSSTCQFGILFDPSLVGFDGEVDAMSLKIAEDE